jgi:large subunit ribosomal protein L5
VARLQETYKAKILPAVKEQFEVKNPMQLPRVAKICVSMGMGEYHSDVKKIEQCAKELSVIVGQKAVITRAKISEAGFKIRQGMPIGVRVTLRGQRMWEFMDRFLSVAAPRIADFRGFSRTGFDKAGNYSFGVKEQSLFPEVNLDKMEITQGMNINVVFENSTPEVSESVLEQLGFPFTRKKEKRA